MSSIGRDFLTAPRAKTFGDEILELLVHNGPEHESNGDRGLIGSTERDIHTDRLHAPGFVNIEAKEEELFERVLPSIETEELYDSGDERELDEIGVIRYEDEEDEEDGESEETESGDEDKVRVRKGGRLVFPSSTAFSRRSNDSKTTSGGEKRLKQSRDYVLDWTLASILEDSSSLATTSASSSRIMSPANRALAMLSVQDHRPSLKTIVPAEKDRDEIMGKLSADRLWKASQDLDVPEIPESDADSDVSLSMASESMMTTTGHQTQLVGSVVSSEGVDDIAVSSFSPVSAPRSLASILSDPPSYSRRKNGMIKSMIEESRAVERAGSDDKEKDMTVLGSRRIPYSPTLKRSFVGDSSVRHHIHRGPQTPPIELNKQVNRSTLKPVSRLGRTSISSTTTSLSVSHGVRASSSCSLNPPPRSNSIASSRSSSLKLVGRTLGSPYRCPSGFSSPMPSLRLDFNTGSTAKSPSNSRRSQTAFSELSAVSSVTTITSSAGNLFTSSNEASKGRLHHKAPAVAAGMFIREGARVYRMLKQRSDEYDRSNADGSREDRLEIARKLLTEFMTHGGCTEQQHAKQKKRHDARTGRHEHLNLDVFLQWARADAVPSAAVLVSNELDHERRKNVRGACVDFLDASTAQALFSGLQGTTQEPSKICLHAETPSATALDDEFTFDVDSFMFFANTFAFARRGISFNLNKNVTLNIDRDPHLEVLVDVTDIDTELPQGPKIKRALNKIPHVYVGRVMGGDWMPVYLLLPGLKPASNEESDRNRLKDAEYEVLIDRILLRALKEVVGSTGREAFPTSVRSAVDKSLARSKETGVMRNKNESSIPKRQQMEYVLDEEWLDALWKRMRQIVAESEIYAPYRGMMLFVDVKNTKKAQSGRTIPEAMYKFFGRLNMVVDLLKIPADAVWLDLASQATPRDSMAATTLLPKMCCLADQVARLAEIDTKVADGLPATLKMLAPKAQFFHTALLGEAGTMRMVTQKRSRLYRAGVPFVQHYSTQKLAFDSQGLFPFSGGRIGELAIAENDRTRFRQMRGETNIDDSKILQNYQASVERTMNACNDHGDGCFGDRFEVRMTLSMALAMVEVMDDLISEVGEEMPSMNKDSCWEIDSRRWFGYIGHQVNKFAIGYEAIMHKTNRHPSWEDTKVAMSFLQHLRSACVSDHLPSITSMWSGPRLVGKDRTVCGLAYEKSITKYGVCWMPTGLFNWRKMQFSELWRDRVMYGNSEMYRKIGMKAEGKRHIHFEAMVELMTRCTCEMQYSLLMRVLALHICRSMRGKTWKSMISLIRATDFCTDAEAGRIALTSAEHLRLTGHHAALTKAKHGAVKSFDHLFDLLFARETEKVRGHFIERGSWETSEFRSWYSRVSDAFRRATAVRSPYQQTINPAQWEEEVKHVLRAYCTILPCPHFSLTGARVTKFLRKASGRNFGMLWFPVARSLEDNDPPGVAFKKYQDGRTKDLAGHEMPEQCAWDARMLEEKLMELGNLK